MAEKIEFCILDTDYLLETERQALIRIWGRTREGKTVLALDRRFLPFFYILPKPGLDKGELEDMEKRLKDLNIEGKRPLKVEMLDKKIYGKSARVFRVTLENPTDVPKFRDLVKNWKETEEEYEYSISFYRRYMINKGLIPMAWVSVEGREVKTDLQADVCLEIDSIKPIKEEKYPNFRVMAFDLEAVHEDGEERIIMLSMKDNRGFSRVLTYRGRKGRGIKLVKDEKGLLEEFLKAVRERDPDILATYNGDRYDFPRLDERAEKHKVTLTLGRDKKHVVFRRRGRISSAQMNGRVHVDLYDFIENILSDTLSSEILTLDSVSREILGKGKKDMDMKDIEKSWKGNIKHLAEHCMQDSELTLGLSKRLLPQIFELCRVSGQKLFDTARMSYSQLVEWLLIREAFKTDEIIPNMPRFDEIRKRRLSKSYVGGYVYPPEQGIHDKIALFDFASLYPSITITHNVSPETLDCQCCSSKPIGAKVSEKEDILSARKNRVPGEPHYFCLRHKGFIPGILERLVEFRSEIREKLKQTSPKSPRYKDLYNRQYALKILANASYGYYGYPGSRWYSKICAQSITAWGRFYIQKVIAFAKNRKYRVIYGDTDSLFLKVRNEKDARKFLRDVKAKLPKTMHLAFKGLYKSGIFVPTKAGTAAKKRYALIDSEENITIRGFEKVRRDWSDIAKKTQEEVLLHILRDKSPEKALNRVRSTIKRIEKGRVDFDDLVIYTQLTKPLEEYEQIGPHVAAARKARTKGIPVKEGSVIAYIITKGTGSISERAVPLELAKNYDPEYYIHNQVIPAALRVLAGLGYTEDDILKKRPQASLDKFIQKGLKHRLKSGITKLSRKEKN